MLSDSVADSKMSYITWIIIILIAVSIVVTVSEVVLRFAMLQKSKGEGEVVGEMNLIGSPVPELSAGTAAENGVREDVLGDVKRLVEGMEMDELRRWRAVLSAEQMEGICGRESSEL